MLTDQGMNQSLTGRLAKQIDRSSETVIDSTTGNPPEAAQSISRTGAFALELLIGDWFTLD